MLKLLTITLSRSSTLLSGDNYNILPEVLERLLPLLARAELAALHAEVADVVCKILTLVHATAPSLLDAINHGAVMLFEGGRIRGLWASGAVWRSTKKLLPAVAGCKGAWLQLAGIWVLLRVRCRRPAALNALENEQTELIGFT